MQSKALGEKQKMVKRRKKQRMSQSYSSHFAQLLSHHSHPKAFTAISLQKAWVITTPLFLNELLLIKTSKYFYLNEKRLKLKIFTWLHVDEIKSTLDLLHPGHTPKLHIWAKNKTWTLISTRRKSRSLGQEKTRTAGCSVAPLKQNLHFVFQCHLVPGTSNLSPSTS